MCASAGVLTPAPGMLAVEFGEASGCCGMTQANDAVNDATSNDARDPYRIRTSSPHFGTIRKSRPQWFSIRPKIKIVLSRQ